MSELLPNAERPDDKPEIETGPEVAETPEIQAERLDKQSELRAEAANAEKTQEKRRETAREKIEKIHDEPARSASRIIQVPLERLEPVVETITKTWAAIRQSLSPSQKTFSKVIHNPVVSSVTEFTAKTLARPYAILAGSIVAVIGSGIYLYFARHLSYQYNYFVPLLLFAAGMIMGLIVEALFKLLSPVRKK